MNVDQSFVDLNTSDHFVFPWHITFDLQSNAKLSALGFVQDILTDARKGALKVENVESTHADQLSTNEFWSLYTFSPS